MNIFNNLVSYISSRVISLQVHLNILIYVIGLNLDFDNNGKM